MLVMLSGALPERERVAKGEALLVVMVWAPKAARVERLTTGAGVTGAVPVPVRLTLWGLPAASSVTVRAPERVPMAVGVNVTLMVQLPAAANGETQLLV